MHYISPFPMTMEYHHIAEIFTHAIDQQLQQLNNRFSEQTTEILILSEHKILGWL